MFSKRLPTWNNALQAGRLPSGQVHKSEAAWEASGLPRGRSSISNPTWGWKRKQSSQTPQKKGVWGVLGIWEQPKRLRFQDLAVNRKFSLNLTEGRTQGHLALTNQNKSSLSNGVYKHCAPATSAGAPPDGPLLPYSDPERQLRNKNSTVTQK